MQIFVKTKTEDITMLCLKPSESIDNLKGKLYDKEEISHQKILIFAGKQLDNGRTLASYNITNKFTLYLALILREQMVIFVKITDKILTLDVKPSDLIENLKAKI